MDKSWMKEKKWTYKFRDGVKRFIEFASVSKNSQDKIFCPCNKCKNRYFHLLDDVEDHLLRHGIFVGYDIWTRHGEERCSTSASEQSCPRTEVCDDVEEVEEVEEDEYVPDLEDLVRDTFEVPSSDNPEQQKSKTTVEEEYEKLNEELYPGCEVSKLSFTLQLYRLKCLNSWSISSFDLLLELISSVFPKDNVIPKSTYKVKTLLKKFELGYERIHACPKDCMLFWGDKVGEDQCQNCGTSRWHPDKKKELKKPAKIMRYFPLIPRLQRLFKHKKTAEMMVWHEKERKKDGMIRHVADGEAWKSFDIQYPDFASDPRNVRLGLSSDGFNPYKLMSTTYSVWPVVLVPYNLPPWIGMKKESFILSTIIPGEKSPGNDIDIYLQPLIKELQDLWNGVPTYDAATGETFLLRATLMWTINDFPAYAMLSGWSTKGKLACPCCADDTDSLWLGKSKKLCYMGHRRWLEADHRFRRQKSQFNNKIESRWPPSRISGSEILHRLKKKKKKKRKEGRGMGRGSD